MPRIKRKWQAIAIAKAAVQEYLAGTVVSGFKIQRNRMIWKDNGWIVRMKMDGTIMEAIQYG